jgi:hypothetical protein
MAYTFGVGGRVTTWDGYPGLVGGSSVTQNTLALNFAAPELDVTGTTSSSAVVSSAFIAGLRNTTATLTSWLSPAIKGNEGLLTVTTSDRIYAPCVQSYVLNINIPEGRATCFDALGVGSEEYIPGPYNWDASFETLFDDAIELILPGLSSICTFQVRDDTAAHTFAGTAIATAKTPTIDPNATSTVPVSLRGTGALTVAGTANTLFTPGALGAFTVGEMDFLLNSGTQIVADAFPTQISISVNPSEPVQITTQVRFTGDLDVNPSP